MEQQQQQKRGQPRDQQMKQHKQQTEQVKESKQEPLQLRTRHYPEGEPAFVHSPYYQYQEMDLDAFPDLPSADAPTPMDRGHRGGLQSPH